MNTDHFISKSIFPTNQKMSSDLSYLFADHHPVWPYKPDTRHTPAQQLVVTFTRPVEDFAQTYPMRIPR